MQEVRGKAWTVVGRLWCWRRSGSLSVSSFPARVLHHADVLAVGVQYAKAMGMRVIAVDGGDDKRKLCLDKLGAEEYIDFTKEKDIPAKVTELTKVWMLRRVECAKQIADALHLVWRPWSDRFRCRCIIVQGRTKRRKSSIQNSNVVGSSC